MFSSIQELSEKLEAAKYVTDPDGVIPWCVRWYLQYPISRRKEMTEERGLDISSICIWRWIQIYGPTGQTLP